MSKVLILSPIFAALNQLEEKFGKDPLWKNANQTLEELLTRTNDLSIFKAEELRAMISRDKYELDGMFDQEEFDSPFQKLNPGEIGIVTFADINLEWNAVAEKISIEYLGNNYQAVSMKSVQFTEKHGPVQTFQVYECGGKEIVCIYTKKGDKVFMASAASFDSGDYDLIKSIDSIRECEKDPRPFDVLIFPALDFQDCGNIPCFTHPSILHHGETWEISQTFEHKKFRMSHIGTPVKHKISSLISQIKAKNEQDKVFTIEKPFYLWLERRTKKGDYLPFIYGFFDCDAWKIPEHIE